MSVGPFEEHIRDAIHINRNRRKLYSELTNGESDGVSRWLIFSEICTIPSTKFPDLWGSYFIKRGVPIVKEEFMPMTGIGQFSSQYPFKPEPISEFIPQKGGAIAIRILRAYFKGGLESASLAIEQELKKIESPRAYHVMLRHVLESTLRVSTLAPLHEQKRRELGIRFSTLLLSKYLFFSHFSAFQFSTWLDRKAAPIQAKGVPILYQDVPAIPAQSDYYAQLIF